MKLTKNFSLSEFDSKDSAKMPDEVFLKIFKLAENLQILRDHFNLVITINSGYRSPIHNARIGGVPSSRHLLGEAADIVVEGKTPTEVFKAIEQLIKDNKMKEGGLKAYQTFTHYDIRGTKARW
jgi:uncharacterized protein YcbK (DUF882 family)